MPPSAGVLVLLSLGGTLNSAVGQMRHWVFVHSTFGEMEIEG